MEELKKLKVAELKERLTALNLPVTGKKEELVARLAAASASSASSSAAKAQTKPKPAAVPAPSAPRTVPPADGAAKGGEVAKAPARLTSPVLAAKPVKAEDTVKATPVPAVVTNAASPVSASVASPAVSSIADAAAMDEEKRRLLRAQRFGIPVSTPTEQVKVAQTKSKQATPTTPAAAKPIAKAKGAVAIGVPEEVLKRRAEKFGLTTPSTRAPAAGTADEATTAKRPRIAAPSSDATLTAEEREKLQKRAERFSGGDSSSASPTVAV